MLAIDNREHFERVLAFAEQSGQLDLLLERLWYLASYRWWAEGEEREKAKRAFFESRGADQASLVGDTVVRLGYDFAAASFSILWTRAKDQTAYMNGGLIYHGNQAGWRKDGKRVDPLNVQLVASDNPWTVNT